MKKTITLLKKAFVIISIIWTTITLAFIGLMAFSGPSSCAIDSPDSESVSEAHKMDINRAVPDGKQNRVPDLTRFYS